MRDGDRGAAPSVTVTPVTWMPPPNEAVVTPWASASGCR